MKIKINKLDVLFSKYIRLRANNHCEYGKEYKEFSELQTAHCFGRRYKSVRWDIDNAAALCFHHHRIIDENHELKREFFIKRLGKQGYQALMVRAMSTNKVDKKMVELQLNELLKEVEI